VPRRSQYTPYKPKSSDYIIQAIRLLREKDPVGEFTPAEINRRINAMLHHKLPIGTLYGVLNRLVREGKLVPAPLRRYKIAPPGTKPIEGPIKRRKINPFDLTDQQMRTIESRVQSLRLRLMHDMRKENKRKAISEARMHREIWGD
jgi:DNA-binding PadR family transcriptional regulator